MTANPSDILDSCRLFMGMEVSSLTKLKGMAILRRYAQGELIFRQADPCPGVFVVGSGLVRIFRTAPSGKEHVLHLIGPGGTFAEVAAIGGFDCPAFAEALEDTTCALLPEEQFSQAVRQNHELCIQLLLGLSGWVKHLIGMVEDITLRDAIGRVARYLLSIHDPASRQVQLPSLKKHLASHLHLTSETLSRTLRRLTEMKLIELKEQEITIIDPAQLDAIAQGMFPEI